uniref:Serpentine receptor class gamma n=1 Tax=Panagrellus redivivus TaxID=6233 RepID=A0A7E4ZYD0_PANRE
MAVDVGEVIINFLGFILILPFDIFLIYHIITRHSILCSPYFVAMTINSIAGAMYMFYSAYLDLNENRFMRISYKFFQYFIPMLSLITSVNRFTAVIFWSHHDKIWKWKFLIIYLIAVFLIALALLLVNHGVLSYRKDASASNRQNWSSSTLSSTDINYKLVDQLFR